MNGKFFVAGVLAIAGAVALSAGGGGTPSQATHLRADGPRERFISIATKSPNFPLQTPHSFDQKTASDIRGMQQVSAIPGSFTGRSGPGSLSIPMTFEPNVGQIDKRIRYVGRGRGLIAFLTDREIELAISPKSQEAVSPDVIKLRFLGGSHLAWRGSDELRGKSNYFIGRNPSQWRTEVPHFSRVTAVGVFSGSDATVYGNAEGIEYDLRLSPGTDTSKVRLGISGADNVRLAANGDLLLRVHESELRMRTPTIYEELIAAHGIVSKRREEGGASARHVAGGYVIEGDGSIGFWVGRHDTRASFVIDPSLSVEYSTFLGGAGTDTAASMALDSSGNLYIAGTTSSAATFSGIGNPSIGPGVSSGVGTTQYFIAKIDPQVSGPNSLVYLTFLGGTGVQTGGLVAIDSFGDAAITGTTASADFPITDGSQLTSGPNDISVSEIDPTGSQLLFSTLFGGSGIESQYAAGGIAIDPSGNILIASDTSSTDLPTTTGSLQPMFGGTTSDGFFAVFTPGASPSLTYCTYLGTNAEAQIGVGGLAVDAAANSYIAGFSSNGSSGFPVKNAFQSSYGGGSSDAFLMKISPLGQGSGDLICATLLGGSGADQALAVAVDTATPPNACITGRTQSANFPINGSTSAYQTNLHFDAIWNAFFW